MACQKRYRKKKKNIFLLGGFNTNLLNDYEYRATNDFLNFLFFPQLASSFLLPYITQPTRQTGHSKVAIDNICCSLRSHEVISGDIASPIPDHFSQFLIISDFSQFPIISLEIFHQLSLIFLKETRNVLVQKFLFSTTSLKIEKENKKISLENYLANLLILMPLSKNSK